MNRHLVTAVPRGIGFGLPSLVALALLTSSLAHGAATPPDLTWSLAQFDFGDVVPGQSSSQTFTLSNTGSKSSGNITVTTGSTVFVITANSCTGRALGPNKSCSVTVEYAPSNTNGDTGTLTADGKHDTVASLNLSGNNLPNLVLDNGRLINTINGTKVYDDSFGANPGSLTTEDYTVSNTGTGTSETLKLDESQFNNPPFLISNDTCTGVSLGPSGMCTFRISFTLPSNCQSGDLFNGGVLNVSTQPTSVTYISIQVSRECFIFHPPQ